MKQQLTFELLIDNIKSQRHFSWSRFGDGEWNCILQKRPGASNCDGHEYFPDLGQRLKKIVESQPSYHIGLQRLAKEQNKDNEEFNRLVEMNEWCNNELLHHASIKGRFDQFLEALGGKDIILVGNETLRAAPIEYYDFVTIPEKNCWKEHSATYHSILRNLRPHTIILYCASMMSKVLIDDLHTLDYTTQIDCGSVLDPYVGRLSRSYMKKLEI